MIRNVTSTHIVFVQFATAPLQVSSQASSTPGNNVQTPNAQTSPPPAAADVDGIISSWRKAGPRYH